MKNKKHSVLLWATSAILLLLLFIQINWIYRAAKMEEKLFGQKVEMALIQTRHDIAESKLLCDSMKFCVKTFQCPHFLKKKKLAEVDSLIQKNLRTYHLHLDYEFEVEDVKINGMQPCTHNCYMQSLEGILKEDGILLRINFPARNQFIMGQIGGMFVLSVVLIVALLVIFWIIIRSYVKEKQIAARTRDFINNMTHEFKTPLANIGFANNLLSKSQELKDAEKLLNYTSIIESEKNKLKHNVEEILNIAHFESNGKHCNHFEKHSLNIIVEESIDAIKFQLEDRGGSVERDLQTIPDINTNKQHLLSAIINILDNSIKYSKEVPEITVKTVEKNEWIVLSIVDKGIGIKERDQKFIFDKYFRVSTGDVHNVKGFGIGLTYVKKVVDEHQGMIKLESKINKGTTIHVYLPKKCNN